jgi:hypothetical protein
MQEHWIIAENDFWRRKWFFFRKFDVEHASSIAARLMRWAFVEAGVPIMRDEDERILKALVDFIRQNSPRKWSTRCPYLCIGMQPAKDPRRFALKLSRVPFPARPRTAQVEWTYDFRPGSKIQGRQIDEHEI